ncbi:hypothetical protein JCM13991_11030 [Thermodesulfovibrio hydrogeniphilus]
MFKITMSIRWLFVISIAILVLAITLSSYLFSYHAYKKQLDHHITDISYLFQKETENLTKPVESFLYSTQALVCCGILNFNDIEKTNKFLIEFMQKYPYVTSINYGDGKGNGYLILNAEGKLLNRIKKADEKGYVRWNELDKDGKILNTKKVRDDYDPRNTTWYKQAIQSQNIAWSEPYLFRTTKDQGITASLLLCSEAQIVIGVDIMIKDFSKYLTKIKQASLDPYAELYLITGENKIIAIADIVKFEPGIIYTLNEQDFPLLYHALKINKEKFRYKNQDWLLRVKKWNMGERELSLAILLPHYVITKDLRVNLFYQLLSSMIFAFLIILYIARQYSNPLIEISKKIKDFGEKEIKLPQHIRRKDEIGVLSKSIEQVSLEIIKTKNALIDTVKKCQTISNLAPVGIFLVNWETGKIEEANHTGLSLIGYTKNEIEKRSFFDIFILSADIKEQESFEILCKFLNKNGETRECKLRGIRLIIEDKPHFLIAVDDVTEMRRLMKRVSEAEQFEAVKRSLGEAVHRFKDLLNVIHGFATLAQTKESIDFAKNALEQILNATKRAIYLTKQLLTLTGERKYELHKVDLNSILLSIRSKIEVLMGENIKVEIKTLDKELPVNIDIEAFNEIMTNIILNAKDAMPNGGILTIETEISQIHDKKYAMLSISDTGEGMDEETRKRVFEPFFTTKGTSGTGLGLSIVYRIVHDLQGFIEVESTLAKGTTFKIFLPLTD